MAGELAETDAETDAQAAPRDPSLPFAGMSEATEAAGEAPSAIEEAEAVREIEAGEIEEAIDETKGAADNANAPLERAGSGDNQDAHGTPEAESEAVVEAEAVPVERGEVSNADDRPAAEDGELASASQHATERDV